MNSTYFFHRQISKTLRYRFSVIMSELRQAEIVPYKTTILAFINCILVATKSLDDRIRLRNEFIGQSDIDPHSNFQDCALTSHMSRFDYNEFLFYCCQSGSAFNYQQES